MSFKLIVTLGPSIMQAETIKEIDKAGTCIFRINGSHSNINEVSRIVDFVKTVSPDIELMIDLPGNKIRISKDFEKIEFQQGDIFNLQSRDLNFPEFYKYLKEDDVLYTNDSLNSLSVCRINDRTGAVTVKAENSGSLLHNKGIHLRQKNINLPFILEKDRQIIELINNLTIDYLALSFVRNVKDIQDVKSMLSNDKVNIIAKVEKMEAIHNIDSIVEEVEHILIDRGDLSNDVGMLHLPFYQDYVVKKAVSMGKNVYLATQFLKYMEHESIPLIAEIMGLHNDISKGVAGIQLSEETAVGKHPLECIKLVFGMYNILKSQDLIYQGQLRNND